MDSAGTELLYGRISGLAFEEWQKALEYNPSLKEARNYLKLLKKEENSSFLV